MKSIRLLLFLAFCLLPCSSFAQNHFKGVIYAVVEMDHYTNKYIVAIDSTGNITYLTDTTKFFREITCSPDGKKIAYCITRFPVIQMDYIKQLGYHRLDEFQDIYESGEHPKPADKNSGYVFNTAEIWMMNSDGTGKTQLSDPGLLTYNEHIRWSPDSKKLVYTSFRPYGLTRGSIWEMDIETKSERKIEINLGKFGEKGYDLGTPDYSPDGRYILFTNSYIGKTTPDLFIKHFTLGKFFHIRKLDINTYFVQWSSSGGWLLEIGKKTAICENINNSGHYPLDKFDKYDYSKVFSIIGSLSPDSREIALLLKGKNYKNQKLFIYDKYFKKRRKIDCIPNNIANISWGGYPRETFTGEIKHAGGEIVYYDLYQILLIILLISFTVYFWFSAGAYLRISKYYYPVPAALVSVLFYFLVWDTAEFLYVIFLTAIAVTAWTGKKSGRFLRTEVNTNRKELLVSLLEFGHSGRITNNLDQLIMHANMLNSGGKINMYAQKRLLESWTEFNKTSYVLIKSLSRQAKYAMFRKPGKRILRSLKKLSTKEHFGIFYEQKSFIPDITGLKSSIKELETAVDTVYSCNILKATGTIVNNFEDEFIRKDIKPLRLETGEIDSRLAKIDCMEYGFILENLISNAVKTVYKSKTRQITVNLESDETRFFVRVTDTGAGIEKDKWEHIFSPGYSETGGTGIGLYYSRQYLMKYRGYLKVEKSSPGSGTTFLLTLRIPAQQKKDN